MRVGIGERAPDSPYIRQKNVWKCALCKHDIHLGDSEIVPRHCVDCSGQRTYRTHTWGDGYPKKEK